MNLKQKNLLNQKDKMIKDLSEKLENVTKVKNLEANDI